jgi:CHRD domain
MPRIRAIFRPCCLRLRRARHMLTLAAGLSLLASPMPARAEHILYTKLEFGAVAYAQGTAHVSNSLAPEPPHAHKWPVAPVVFPPAFFQPPPVTLPASPNWHTGFVIGESAPGSAYLYSSPNQLDGKAATHHRVSPDGDEAPIGPVLPYSLTATVPEPPVIPGYVTQSIADSRSGQGAKHGPDDRDLQVVAMAAFWFKAATPAGSVFQLRGYVHGSVGIHVFKEGPGSGFRAILSGEKQVPGNNSMAVGVVPMALDESDSTFTMLLMVHGITPDQLTAANICVGSEGQGGKPIVDLGPASAWQPWPDGSGMTRVLVREPFPQEFLNELKTGQTYVSLATRHLPHGQIRGQLDAVPIESAQPMPIAATGYNADVISDQDRSIRFAQPFDANTFAWFQSGAVDDSGVQHDDGLPAGRSFTTASNSGAIYEIQPANNPNVLQLSPGRTGTLTLTTPEPFSTLYILAASGDGTPISTGNGNISFADGSTQAFRYDVFDWCDRGQSPGAVFPGPLGRADIGPSGTSFVYLRECDYQLYETIIPIDPWHAGIPILSIDFTGAPDAFYSNIFGVSGQ